MSSHFPPRLASHTDTHFLLPSWRILILLSLSLPLWKQEQEWGPCLRSAPAKDGSAKVRGHTHTQSDTTLLLHSFLRFRAADTPPNWKQMVKVWLCAVLRLNFPLVGRGVSVALKQSGIDTRGRTPIGWEAHWGAGAREFNLVVVVACSCCLYYSWPPAVTVSIWSCAVLHSRWLRLFSHCVDRLTPFPVCVRCAGCCHGYVG